MTPAQKKALDKFFHAKSPALIPQGACIRTDIARKLLDAGYVEFFHQGDLFRGGYAPLKITELGRSVVTGESQSPADRGGK